VVPWTGGGEVAGAATGKGPDPEVPGARLCPVRWSPTTRVRRDTSP